MKRCVYAMSLPKSEALKRASYYSDDIMEHLIKILVYHNIRNSDTAHWIGEISSWLKFVDGLTVKPSNRHLKPAAIKNTTFAPMGDHLKDYLGSLQMFQDANKKGKFNYGDKVSYPYVEPDSQTASDLMQLCNDIMEITIPMLCSKIDYSRREYEDALNKILQRYVL